MIPSLVFLLLVQDGTWSTPVELDAGQAGAVFGLARGAGDSLHLATAGKDGIRIHSSKDGGKSWSEPLAVQGARFGRFLPGRAPAFLASKGGELLVVEGATSSAIPNPDEFGKARYEHSSMVVEGDRIHLVQTTEHPVHVLFTSSPDGGKTWAPWTFVAKNLWENDSMPAALWIETVRPRDPKAQSFSRHHVVYNTGEKDGHKTVHVASDNAGKTWVAVETRIELEAELKACYRAAVVDGTVVLAFLGGSEKAGLSYYAVTSKDGGATWSKAAKIDDTRAGDLCVFFDLQASGSTLLFTFSTMGKSDLHAKEARLLTSADGVSWKNLAIGADVEGGDTGWPVALAGKDGRVVAACLKHPKEGQPRALGSVIVRTWEPKK